MTDQLELAKHLEPFMLISTSVSVADALTKLHNAHENFAVIEDANQPQTLVQEEHLAKLTNAEHRLLSEVLNQLPPLVLIDGGLATLDSNDLNLVSLLLGQTEAPGLVVYQDKHVTGVISLETIADALPLDALPTVTVKSLYGNYVTSTRSYICRKCAKSDPPPPRAAYRAGDEAPDCPKHPFLHGPMEREDT